MVTQRWVRGMRGALLAGTLALGIAAPAGAMQVDASDLQQAFGGTWEFQMQATTPGMSSDLKAYTKTRRVHFTDGKFDTNPQGFASAGFRLRSYAPGGTTAFESPYAIGGGGQFGMDFKGQLSSDGNAFTGSFSFCMVSGTVSAVREAVVCDVAMPKIAIGDTGEVKLHLTLKPDAPVVVHAALLRGDKGLHVADASLTFSASNWDQPQALEIDAAKVEHASKAYIRLTGEGLPDTVLPIRLVRSQAH